jgi:hypothetical protein
MKNGYPTKDELNKVKNWPVEDFAGLINMIRDLWQYNSEIKAEWFKDRLFGFKLRLTLCTVGWSGNEDVIEALLKNKMFTILWYAEWYRGGKYVFEIDPVNVGYKLISIYCKEKSISRQAIYQSKDKYDFIKVSEKVVFVKAKN